MCEGGGVGGGCLCEGQQERKAHAFWRLGPLSLSIYPGWHLPINGVSAYLISI